MRISKKQVNDILDLVWDWSDYYIGGTKYQGYEVYPSVDEEMKRELGKEIAKIIKGKRRRFFQLKSKLSQ